MPIIGNPILIGGGSSSFAPLWTNSNPTAGFAAQTIAKDLSLYDAVLITYHNFSSGDAQYGIVSQICPKGAKSGLQFTSASNNRNGNRFATVSDSGVEFSACTYNNGTNNGYGVPYQIFGIL